MIKEVELSRQVLNPLTLASQSAHSNPYET